MVTINNGYYTILPPLGMIVKKKYCAFKILRNNIL